jgi:3-oxoacyl-[acyl-carrier protein] reductase
MFKDRKLLVTGGAGSIGSSICNYFKDNGCEEIFSTTTNLNKVKPDQNYINFKELNLNNIEISNLEDLFDFDIDFLILNAGLNKDNIFLRMSSDDWNSVINVNLNSSFHLLKHFVKKMVKRRFGRVVFISSVVAYTGNPGQVNYTASKSAISGLVKSLALELSTRNITVNSVAPGFIQSNMTDKLNDDQKNTILERIPMKKLGDSSDIAKAVGFLCSENANYITGQTLHVNGGLALI